MIYYKLSLSLHGTFGIAISWYMSVIQWHMSHMRLSFLRKAISKYTMVVHIERNCNATINTVVF